MKKIGRYMAIYMGVTMSFILSFVGTLLSGHFTLISWIISFAISLIISLIIGFSVPIKPICDWVCGKCKLSPESKKGNLCSAFVSNLIYTPLITVIMTSIMVNNAASKMKAAGVTQGIPTVKEALPLSLVVCCVVGYVIICIVQPIFISAILKKTAPKKAA